MNDAPFEPTDPEAVPDYARQGRLDDRNVVVAGAGAGIGRQTAHALAAAGARVGCIDVTDGLAEAVAAEVGGYALVGDVCEEDDVVRLLDGAEAHGPIGGIVDIVGAAGFVDILDTTNDDWVRSQRINLQHALLIARLGGAAMARTGGGSIVYINSFSGVSGAAHHALYGIAKAGLTSLVGSAAVELGPLGIRVNSVAPGIVWTPRMAAFIGADDAPRWASLSPLGRMALPSDIASVVLFLTSDLAGYITGQNIIIDGGVSATTHYPIDDLYAKANPGAADRRATGPTVGSGNPS